MKSTPLASRIEKLISPTAKSMGYDIVRILLVGAGSGRPTLQIMAEKPDGTMDVEDCGRLSQAASALLDVEDIIAEAYYLEVSSPGLDRPLTRPADFETYKDNDVKIEMEDGINGQKKFRGMLRGLSGKAAVLELEDGATVALPLNDILRAKLVLTDELVAKAMKAQEPKKEPKYKPKSTKPNPKAKQKKTGSK